jgi:histidinol-phosphate aminotransferase
MCPPIDLWLDGNEGPAAPDAVRAGLAVLDPERVRRYPDERELAAELAARFHRSTIDEVVLGAGADELLDRACRAFLAPGRAAVLPVPCFPMMERYVALAGGELRCVPWWEGPFPRERLIGALGDEVALVVLASPNNPTGLVLDAADLRAVAMRAPQALVLVDLAYAEFAGADLGAVASQLPNAIVLRTFSKAFGLAGLRVGFALGPPHLLEPLRACGSPYPCAGPSLQLALSALRRGVDAAAIARICAERGQLARALAAAGCAAMPGEANFVFARARSVEHARALASALAARGIAIRTFAEPELAAAVRIACPGDEAAFGRLLGALSAAPTDGTEGDRT